MAQDFTPSITHKAKAGLTGEMMVAQILAHHVLLAITGEEGIELDTHARDSLIDSTFGGSVREFKRRLKRRSSTQPCSTELTIAAPEGVLAVHRKNMEAIFSM